MTSNIADIMVTAKSANARKNETRVLKRSLLHLLDKLVGMLEETIAANFSRLSPFRPAFHKRLSVIKKVLHRQTVRFDGGEVKGLIVSVDKDYIRPIVRGKERKRVEFGAKVNTIQVEVFKLCARTGDIVIALASY